MIEHGRRCDHLLGTAGAAATTSDITVGNAPNAIVFSPDGAHAYVVNADDSTMSVIDTATATVGATATIGSVPTDVAISPDGILAFVTDNGDNTDVIGVAPAAAPAPAVTAVTLYTATLAAAGGTTPYTLSITGGRCTTTITGRRAGPLTAGPGITCIAVATISGRVTIPAGAAVPVSNSTISGPLNASRPTALSICASAISGPVTVTTGSTEVEANHITGRSPAPPTPQHPPATASPKNRRRPRQRPVQHPGLTIFTMSEDDNEGVFGPPPRRGNADRISQQMLGQGNLEYKPTKNTLRGWAESDAAVKDILERAAGSALARPPRPSMGA